MPAAIRIELTDEQKETLQSWIRSTKCEKRLVDRAAIILLSAEGLRRDIIAERLRLTPYVISRWRKRFTQAGVTGLFDQPRSGKPVVYGKQTEKRVLALLDEDPPEGYSRWNGPLIAERLGDVSVHGVWRILRVHGIHLERKRSWCISTDPEFAAKAADIIGLYMSPPEGALVFCVDEKPCIQALERAQGYLRMPNGKAVLGVSHEYKRNGTTTLFAALDIASGMIEVKHTTRKRRREFLDFMNELVRDIPEEQDVHVVLDNLRTHKPKNDRWLARHKNVHFHYTPTHASWMNMVEIWFSILQTQSLRNSSFTSVKQLRKHMDAFIENYNKNAHPFEWKKVKVKNVKPEHKYSDLCK